MTQPQHATVERLYGEIAEQLDWPRGSGLKRTPWQWHQMMLAAFVEEKGWKTEFVPSLTGSGFVLTTRMKQSRLTKKQGSELIEFAHAWAANNGVEVRDREEAFQQ